MLLVVLSKAQDVRHISHLKHSSASLVVHDQTSGFSAAIMMVDIIRDPLPVDWIFLHFQSF